MKRKITLIVLTWNRWYLTERCLDSLAQTNIGDAKVLVVDNGSTDSTLKNLENYDWLDVISLDKNYGYVRGNNAGIEASDPDSDIVLLNNDLQFTQEDWLERLTDCAHEQDDIGIVGARLINNEGRLLHAGTYILPDDCWGQQIGSGSVDYGQYEFRREVSGIVFACAYIKRSTINEVGVLSEDFISYFEDTDYCLRVTEAGKKIFCCGDVTLMHDEHGSTKGDGKKMMKLFRTSQRVFKKKWKKKLENNYDQEVRWQSIINFPTGYATSSREFVLALEKQGTKVSYDYIYGPSTIFPVVENTFYGDHRINLIASRSSLIQPKVSIAYSQGDVLYRNNGRYKVGFTMLEVNGFPFEWVRQAQKMDEIWVPSQFAKEAYLSCGLTKPIYKIPLGIDTDIFRPDGNFIDSPNDDYVFLSLFEWGERKEPELILKTFNATFSADEDVRLVAKIMNTDPSINLRERIANLELDPNGGRIDFIVNREFAREDLPTLYRSSDCFLSPSKGEGWNMPLMEAMACGLPCIATDWSAQTEFFNSSNGFPIEVTCLEPAKAKCPYYEGFYWAKPDKEHFRYLMRQVFENREDAAKIGTIAAIDVAKNWTWDSAAHKIRQRLDDIGA
ncbi:glycosyltransferase [Arenicella xantha]|uniref:Glycosyltransferase 2-like domain-containing protein n=1 Tax=Arenicella xantha TaxID=644221 RepID=A0A395JMC0_9GAMM|nr:glycosyltransferase [Arenicella xantha]RBP50997.1 hypothetical protein DFR28_102414 [Arenicella xantha]